MSSTNHQRLPNGEERHYTWDAQAGAWLLDWRKTAVTQQEGAGAGKSMAQVEADYGTGAAAQPEPAGAE